MDRVARLPIILAYAASGVLELLGTEEDEAFLHKLKAIRYDKKEDTMVLNRTGWFLLSRISPTEYARLSFIFML